VNGVDLRQSHLDNAALALTALNSGEAQCSRESS